MSVEFLEDRARQCIQILTARPLKEGCDVRAGLPQFAQVPKKIGKSREFQDQPPLSLLLRRVLQAAPADRDRMTPGLGLPWPLGEAHYSSAATVPIKNQAGWRVVRLDMLQHMDIGRFIFLDLESQNAANVAVQ